MGVSTTSFEWDKVLDTEKGISTIDGSIGMEDKTKLASLVGPCEVMDTECQD